MRRAKRQVNGFINYLFAKYNVPRIPVYVHWHHDTLIGANNDLAFGVFWYDEHRQEIHVAGKRAKKSGVMQCIAHEFTHYLQWLHHRDMSDDRVEADAEYHGAGLLGQYLINKKDKHRRVDGTASIWEPKV